MSSLNKAMIIGRLGQDPEVRYTQSNTAVATLNVATTERYKNKNGETDESTEWHRIIAWGRLAEICSEYLKKGSLCYFEGPIKTREWTDKDGVKKYTTEITALSMQMLGDAGGGVRQPRAKADSGPAKTAELEDGFDDMGDDLPF